MDAIKIYNEVAVKRIFEAATDSAEERAFRRKCVEEVRALEAHGQAPDPVTEL